MAIVLPTMPGLQYAIDITNQSNFKYFFTTTCQKNNFVGMSIKIAPSIKFLL